MELWDAYDVRGNSLEHTLIRGEEVPAGEYHLVADILVRHTDGSFLLTQRDPQKPAFPGCWELSAGGSVLAGETALSGAMRELREETGLSAERTTHLTTLLTTPGFCTEKIAVYLAQGLSQGDTHPDEDEFLGLVRLPLEEAFEMVMRGEICDGKTICGLMMAREIVARQKA